MEVYLAPVILTFAALAVQSCRNSRFELVSLVGTMLTSILIIGLRWYADIDYDSYVAIYDFTPSLTDFSGGSIVGLHGEPGYLLFSALFKSLGSGFGLVAMACAMMSVSLKSFVIYRLAKQASLALSLYLCLHFVTIEFIQLRWAVATGWIALGFYSQYKESYKIAVLCFIVSLGFHYFSVLYCLVALIHPLLNGHKRFYAFFVASLLVAYFIKLDTLAGLLISDSDAYLLSRITAYTADTDSHVGLFSYARLVMYPLTYAVCVGLRPSFPWRSDSANAFLFKLSFASLCLTLLTSFMPIMHFRAVVIADLFSILWIINALDTALAKGARTVAFGALCFLFITWYLIDLKHHIQMDRLFEYHTWLNALR